MKITLDSSLEDAELEQEEIAFRARPASAVRDPLNDPAWLAANVPDRATMAARREREAAVFDKIAKSYSMMREKAARALIDYASKPRQSDAPTPNRGAEPLDPLTREMGRQMRRQGEGIEAVFPIDEAPTMEGLAAEIAAMGSQPDSLPLRHDIRIAGTWRVYFHRLNPDGLPWCVAPDAGGWEIAVANVAIDAPSSTVYAPKATPDDEDGRPSAWIAVTGVLTVNAAGQARIAP